MSRDSVYSSSSRVNTYTENDSAVVQHCPFPRFFLQSRRQTGTANANDRDIRSWIITMRVTSQILRTLLRRQMRFSQNDNHPWHYSIAIVFTNSFLPFSRSTRKITATSQTNRRRGRTTRNSTRREIGTDTRYSPSSTIRETSYGSTRAEIGNSTNSLRPKGPPDCVPRAITIFRGQ